MQLSDITAIVPIKKDSQRVPGKNFRILAGKPLWAHIVHKMAQSHMVGKVIIDTDCPELIKDRVDILLHASRRGATIEVRERPEHLRGHTVPMTDIIRAILDDEQAELFIQVHATNPFISVRSMSEALADMAKGGIDSVASVTEHQSRMWHMGYAVNHDAGVLVQTQDLGAVYEENSSFYMFKRDAFLRDGTRLCGNWRFRSIPPIEAIDIDDEDGWELAQVVARGLDL